MAITTRYLNFRRAALLVAVAALIAAALVVVGRAWQVPPAAAPDPAIRYHDALASADARYRALLERAETMPDAWTAFEWAAGAALQRARLSGSFEDYAAARCAAGPRLRQLRGRRPLPERRPSQLHAAPLRRRPRRSRGGGAAAAAISHQPPRNRRASRRHRLPPRSLRPGPGRLPERPRDRMERHRPVPTVLPEVAEPAPSTRPSGCSIWPPAPPAISIRKATLSGTCSGA